MLLILNHFATTIHHSRTKGAGTIFFLYFNNTKFPSNTQNNLKLLQCKWPTIMYLRLNESLSREILYHHHKSKWQWAACAKPASCDIKLGSKAPPLAALLKPGFENQRAPAKICKGFTKVQRKGIPFNQASKASFVHLVVPLDLTDWYTCRCMLQVKRALPWRVHWNWTSSTDSGSC